jgi:hypothetical protein
LVEVKQKPASPLASVGAPPSLPEPEPELDPDDDPELDPDDDPELDPDDDPELDPDEDPELDPDEDVELPDEEVDDPDEDPLPPSAGLVVLTVQPVVLAAPAPKVSSVAVPVSAQIFFVEIIGRILPCANR